MFVFFNHNSISLMQGVHPDACSGGKSHEIREDWRFVSGGVFIRAASYNAFFTLFVEVNIKCGGIKSNGIF